MQMQEGFSIQKWRLQAHVKMSFLIKKQGASINLFESGQKLFKLTNKDLMIFFRKMITGYHVFFGIPRSTAARKTAALWPLEGVLCRRPITRLRAAWASRV
jgi:hypothetical protein